MNTYMQVTPYSLFLLSLIYNNFLDDSLITLEIYLVALLVLAFQPLLSWLVVPHFVPQHNTQLQRITALLHLKEYCYVTSHQESSPHFLCSNQFLTWSIEQYPFLLHQNLPLAFSLLKVLVAPPQSCIHHFSHPLSMCMHIL